MRAASSAADPADERDLESHCFELLGEAGGDQSVERGQPGWLKQAADFLRDGEESAGVEAVARSVGVHPVHLTRSFRRHFRCTPGEFARAHRVSRAADLLGKRRMSIAQIAAECSFADQSHLVRSFRRHFGMTPREFRLALD